MALVEARDLGKDFAFQQGRSPWLKHALIERLRGRAAPARPRLTALDGVTFDIPAGTSFGVLGTNGSGKSTLLKIVAGVARPTRGTITRRGSCIALLELGTGFHPEFSGRENVYLGGALLGLDDRAIAARFDDIVAFAELEAFIDQPLRTYSSGMAMRLAFAVASAFQPDLLLLDEVLAVGDAAFQAKCLARIDAMRAAGTALMFVSHDLGAVLRLCDQALWLDRGRPGAIGPAAEVGLAYYRHVAGQQAAPDGDVAVRGVALPGGALAATGGDLAIAVAWAATRPRPDAALRVRVTRGDGVVALAATRPGFAARAGEGELRLHLPRLPLRAGTYTVDVTVLDAGDPPAMLVHQPGCASFLVAGAPDDLGLVEAPHHWEEG